MCVRPALARPPPLPSHLQGLTPPTFVSGKHVVTHEAAAVPMDQDVAQEAEMVETYLEKLREENPLVLREVSKVKSDVPQKAKTTPLVGLS